MIALHSFHQWCFFLGKFTKSSFMNSSKKKKMNLSRKENIFTRALSKSKFFTSITIVLLVKQSCCTCVVLVALMLHSCFTRVALFLHLCCLCCNLVACVWNLCFKTRFENNICCSDQTSAPCFACLFITIAKENYNPLLWRNCSLKVDLKKYEF